MEKPFINSLMSMLCMLVHMSSQVGVFGGGQDRAVTEDFLDFKQVDARLDQMGRITVTKACGVIFFFIPHSVATLRRVV